MIRRNDDYALNIWFVGLTLNRHPTSPGTSGFLLQGHTYAACRGECGAGHAEHYVVEIQQRDRSRDAQQTMICVCATGGSTYGGFNPCRRPTPTDGLRTCFW